MDRRYKGEVDSFWIFMVFLFVLLPLGKTFLNKINVVSTEKAQKIEAVLKEEDSSKTIDIDKEATEATKNTSKKTINIITPSGGGYEKVEVISNSISAQKDRRVQFEVAENTVSAKMKSPSGKEVSMRGISGGIIKYSFDEVGRWEVDAYDKDGFISDWIRVDIF